MKKVISLAATAGLLIAGFALAAGPMNRATGSVTMSGPSQQVSFSAFDAGAYSASDRGSVIYSNFDYPTVGAVNYLTYTVPIMCATVSGSDTRFMYQIPAGWPGLSGLYVLVAVHDGGTPGINGDTYGHTATADLATATSWCEGGVGVTNYAITSGNLVVHAY